MRKLNEVLVSTGAEIYREIVIVALWSLLSSAVLLPIILFTPIQLAMLLLPLLYAPAVFGVFYAYHEKSEGRKSGIRQVVTGALRGFVPAAVFGLFLVLLTLIVISSWWYYGSKEGIFYTAIAIFQTYFVVMALVSQLYAFPLVLQKGYGIFRAMGESVKLFFRHPAYTFGAFIQAVCLSVLLLVTIVGFLGLFNGMLAIYMLKATANLLESRGGERDNETAGLNRS